MKDRQWNYPAGFIYKREKWPPGPWDGESDKMQFADPETGMACLIVRNSIGALCGYVGVDRGHPLHGRGYEQVGFFDVHGGLTFADGCSPCPDDPELGICHVSESGEPDNLWWFGFDCSHCYDVTPGMIVMLAGLRNPDNDRRNYKTVEYVKAECASLARQIKDYTSKEETDEQGS